MNTAYLILAHHQPAHLARLIAALEGDGAALFVHVDAKTELRSFTELVPRAPNVRFLGDASRVKVAWGGFSAVTATLNLLRTALHHGTPFSRYCLLSGSDFPIKNNARIAAAFGTSWEFLRIDERLDYAARAQHAAAVKYRHYYDSAWLNPKTTPFPDRLFAAAERLLRTIPRRRYRGVPLWRGSQWWALTDPCARYVVAFVDQHEDYVAFFRHTALSDESFFHSIIKSSPFAERIFQDIERPADSLEQSEANRHGCHYIDWAFHQHDRPKVLDLTDLPALTASTALFARKFDAAAASADLLDRLAARP